MATVQAAIEDFFLAHEVAGNSIATIKWYRSLLKGFAQQYGQRLLVEVSPSAIRQYIVSVRRRDRRYTDATQRPELSGGLSDESIRAHIRALEGFWSWCVIEYHLPQNPMGNIKQPKRRTSRPRAMSPDDAAKMMAATGDTVEGKRDRALLAFMIDTGCRAQTIFKLELEQLDLKRQRAVVQEKGQDERILFFTSRTADLLAAWLEVRPQTAITVFCSLSPRTKGSPISSTSLKTILNRLAKRAGVTGPHNPHSIRHMFAREYLINGGQLATLSRLMGHADVKVTADYYAVFADSELAASHRKFSPIHSLPDGESGGENS